MDNEDTKNVAVLDAGIETKDISTLTPAPYNPRSIDKHDGESLEASIKRWGDISGITKNVHTGFTVTGHQRISILRKSFGNERVKIVITHKQDRDTQGTVAFGYVHVDGTSIRLSYREVSWSEAEERAANIAANRIQGNFVLELLGEVDQWLLDNEPSLIEFTGQTNDEITRLLGQEAPTKADEDTTPKMSFTLTDDQYVVIERALAHMKAQRNFSSEVNRDLDGNALFYICSQWLEQNVTA